MAIKVGDRIEFGIEAKPRGGVVTSLAGPAAVISWDAGGQTAVTTSTLNLLADKGVSKADPNVTLQELLGDDP